MIPTMLTQRGGAVSRGSEDVIREESKRFPCLGPTPQPHLRPRNEGTNIKYRNVSRDATLKM